jgi:serine/threonine protein kinase
MGVDETTDDALAQTGVADTAVAETQGSSSQLPAIRLADGATLGRYVIKGVLGVGGMGIVYRAHDPQLGRLVALKVVRPGGGPGTRAESRSRLVREAKAMARVAHPNVIVVHDAGSVDDQMFIAMELVDGENLDVWERAALRSWREKLDVYLQAARGLAAAHEANLVHRDFKPANALVARDGRLRVLDFGLARKVSDGPDERVDDGGRDDRAGASMTLTMAGAVMGTPQFMSPEQHRGEPADARSDQFSFCVALYRSVYGRYPFEGTTHDAVAFAVTAGPVPDVPRRTDVPAAIGKVILRGLSRAPEERYPSMTELASALDAALPRRRWPLVIAAISALAALAVALIVMTSRHAPDAPTSAGGFTKNQQPVTLAEELVDTPALAPDGRSLVYGTESGVAFRDLSTGATRHVLEPRTIYDMRWSGSGDRVLAATNEGPAILEPSGGEPRVFALPGEDCSAAWIARGAEILWRCTADTTFTIVTVATGATRPLEISLPTGEVVADVDVSASNIAILTSSANGSSLYIANVDGTSVRKLGSDTDGGTVRWNAAGTRVYYVRAASRGFEIVYRTVTAPATPVVVLAQPQSEMATRGAFTLSRDEKSIILRVRRFKQDVQLAVPGATAVQQLTVDTQLKTALALSPDQTIVFAAGTELEKRLFRMPLALGAPSDLALPAADYRSSVFSPRGDELAFTQVTKAGSELWIFTFATHAARRIEVPPFDPQHLAWLTTGSILLLSNDSTNFIVVDATTGAHRLQWTKPRSTEMWFPAPTPDGTQIAATVPVAGQSSSLVVLAGTSDDSRVISPTSSALPLAWSTDLEWIYASEPAGDDSRMRVVAISASGDGRSRVVWTGIHEGAPPLVTGNGAVLWLSLVETTDLWLATADARGPLPVPPSARAPAVRVPDVHHELENMALAGPDGGAPVGWRTNGTPTLAAITSSCGRPGTCVKLDGASNAAVSQLIDATPYRGRRIRVAADLRVEGGRCMLGVDSGILEHSEIPSGQLHVDEQGWGRRLMTADIAADAKYIQVAAVAQGAGTCWVADVAIAPSP